MPVSSPAVRYDVVKDPDSVLIGNKSPESKTTLNRLFFGKIDGASCSGLSPHLKIHCAKKA